MQVTREELILVLAELVENARLSFPKTPYHIAINKAHELLKRIDNEQRKQG